MKVLRQAFLALFACFALATSAHAGAGDFAVGPQYDTTHVYVAPEDFDRFVASLVATFGGTTSKQGVFTVTPTPSLTMSQLVLTPAGTLSVFGFKTPIPYPFGQERTGYLVSDMDAAVTAARSAGASVVVEPFPDPIGRDAVIQWPGGVDMQIYWHTAVPHYPALAAVPENRVYLSHDGADAFLKGWIAFSHGRIASDAMVDGAAAGSAALVRRIEVESGYGKLTAFVTNGQLAWPFGRELTGYEVPDLAATLAKARSAGVEVLVAPKMVAGRESAMVRFPRRLYRRSAWPRSLRRLFTLSRCEEDDHLYRPRWAPPQICAYT